MFPLIQKRSQKSQHVERKRSQKSSLWSVSVCFAEAFGLIWVKSFLSFLVSTEVRLLPSSSSFWGWKHYCPGTSSSRHQRFLHPPSLSLISVLVWNMLNVYPVFVSILMDASTTTTTAAAETQQWWTRQKVTTMTAGCLCSPSCPCCSSLCWTLSFTSGECWKLTMEKVWKEC